MQHEINKFLEFVKENGGPVFAGDKAFTAIAEYYDIDHVADNRLHVGNVTVIRHSILAENEITCFGKPTPCDMTMKIDLGV